MDLSRRDFAGLIGWAAMGLPGGGAAKATMARMAQAGGDLDFVHPELRPLAEQMRGFANLRFTADTLRQMRASPMPFGQAPRSDIPVLEKRIAVPGGAPDVTVYIVNAKPGASRPAILHTHGGGFIIGLAKSSIADAQSWAAELDCVVATVEYRLAPETRYSGSTEDNYAALRWVHRHAAELGIDPARIAVMGESAGGGHAALLALTARDRGEVPLLFQMLVYPMLDDRTGSSRQVPRNIGTIGWTAEANRFGWESFLGQAPGTSAVPAAAVPARVANLSGLPPAFIGVGAIDLFVEEDMDYARRLIASGVRTELQVVPGAFHGFDIFGAQTSIAKQFTAAKMAALKRAFAGQA